MANKLKKPIDMWLFLIGIAVGIILFLIPKTPVSIAVCLVVVFLLLIHPIWYLWWIEKRLWRRVSSCVLLILILWYLGYISWPHEGEKIPIIRMIGLSSISGTSKMIIRLENSGKSDLLADAVVRLAFVPFSANNIIEDKVSWVKAKSEGSIAAGYSQSYSFDIPKDQLSLSQVTFVVIFVQSNQLLNGFTSDIGYTWDSGQTWALLRINYGNVDTEQSKQIKLFVKKVESCIIRHSQDKEYDSCFL